jgi:hypothetical protein
MRLHGGGERRGEETFATVQERPRSEWTVTMKPVLVPDIEGIGRDDQEEDNGPPGDIPEPREKMRVEQFNELGKQLLRSLATKTRTGVILRHPTNAETHSIKERTSKADAQSPTRLQHLRIVHFRTICSPGPLPGMKVASSDSRSRRDSTPFRHRRRSTFGGEAKLNHGARSVVKSGPP